MINFETMTVAQMKKYLSPKVLQKLSTPELGRLLSAARSVRDFFAQKGGLDASLEAAYWNVAEKKSSKSSKTEITTCILRILTMSFRHSTRFWRKKTRQQQRRWNK